MTTNIREKIKEATEASVKPVERLVEENTRKSIFGSPKVDYEAVIDKIKRAGEEQGYRGGR